MPCIETECLTLSDRQEAEWKWWLALDSHQSFRANEVAGGPEQWMASLNGAHLDAVDLADGSAEYLGVDLLHSRSIRTEAAVADDERKRHRIDAENQRPLLRYDMKQTIHTVRFNRGKYGRMNRRDCAGMTAREGYEVLIRLFNGTEALAQVGYCPFFEWDYRRHCGGRYARRG